MRTVFMVNNGGSYSDYGVECMFIEREDAERYSLEKHRYADGYIEEMVLYGAGESPEKRVVWNISQRIDEDTMSEYSNVEWSYRSTSLHKTRPEIRETNYRGGPIAWMVYAKGLNRDACIKSVADRVARARADFTEWNLDYRNAGRLPSNIRLEWFNEAGEPVGKEPQSRSFFTACREDEKVGGA